MGSRNGPYNADFVAGTRVRIASSETLQTYMLPIWVFHHPLSAEQLDFAGRITHVANVYYYHGGDELYSLEEVPGIWHEACLLPAADADTR